VEKTLKLKKMKKTSEKLTPNQGFSDRKFLSLFKFMHKMESSKRYLQVECFFLNLRKNSKAFPVISLQPPSAVIYCQVLGLSYFFEKLVVENN
jgi:hypothetical protein